MSPATWPVPDLDDEVREVRGLLRPYAEEQLRPVADAAERDATFPRHVVHDLAKLGALGLGFDEALGGSGGSHVGFCVAIEEVYRVSPGIAASAFMSPLVAFDIVQSGNDAQRRRYVPPILEGRTMAALGVTEPDAGSDVASLRTTARRTPQGWRLDGSKAFITNAGLADVMVVLARTPDIGPRAISAFVVDLPTAGVTVEAPLHKLGWRASETNGVSFQGVELAEEAMLGEPGSGLAMVLGGFNLERATLAAGSVGMAQGALDLALEHARTRTQFNAPIAARQAVRHSLARAAARLEAARQLTYRAAALVANGTEGIAAASMAKLVASEMAQDVTRTCVQVHGGAGFMKEYAVERFYRDSMVMTIGGGTSEIQAEIIGRMLGLDERGPVQP
ncbi:MAG: butyryl-CoA dehydrogenase [Nocardioidaceae bacterium]|nr:butyryl-CoA dehydrogenase [Nocardioidaceae bacterium]